MIAVFILDDWSAHHELRTDFYPELDSIALLTLAEDGDEAAIAELRRRLTVFTP